MRGRHISPCLLSACCSSNSADYSPPFSSLLCADCPMLSADCSLLCVASPFSFFSLLWYLLLAVFSLLSSHSFLLPALSTRFLFFSALSLLSLLWSVCSALWSLFCSVFSLLSFSTLGFPCCFLLSPLYFLPLCSLLFPLSSLFSLFAASFPSPLYYLLSFFLLSPLCSLLSSLPHLLLRGINKNLAWQAKPRIAHTNTHTYTISHTHTQANIHTYTLANN